ncbi:hypothetical protein QBC34DRAFT_44899 [Podospora aff. communis PSN243]|uniref:Uncharacterized protein n=1 Tax=Podospora aff. communis PSN243 TaxID=3040156 RepID=A0AAV9GXG1_9PEZI|nr:hypothetical protein QBC34DRAFT_44899 [Podospora aff. communis PSN243]
MRGLGLLFRPSMSRVSNARLAVSRSPIKLTTLRSPFSKRRHYIRNRRSKCADVTIAINSCDNVQDGKIFLRLQRLNIGLSLISWVLITIDKSTAEEDADIPSSRAGAGRAAPSPRPHRKTPQLPATPTCFPSSRLAVGCESGLLSQHGPQPFDFFNNAECPAATLRSVTGSSQDNAKRNVERLGWGCHGAAFIGPTPLGGPALRCHRLLCSRALQPWAGTGWKRDAGGGRGAQRPAAAVSARTEEAVRPTSSRPSRFGTFTADEMQLSTTADKKRPARPLRYPSTCSTYEGGGGAAPTHDWSLDTHTHTSTRHVGTVSLARIGFADAATAVVSRGVF